ncbi:MAG: DUF1311 domain-containing protein [Rhizobiales bacterium]|nr:DUF1311 domain-containing protein [Hyphomicrobiales bacterium]
MTRALAILTCLILATSPLRALAQDAEPDCSDQKDQSTMTRCAGMDYEKADAELNRIWPGIKAQAVESDTAEGNGKTDYLDALMTSQRAWIAYRDAECTRQGFEAHNGSMEPMLVNACLAEMTAKRIKDLQGEGLLQ